MKKRIRFATMMLFVTTITFVGVSQAAWAGSLNATTPPPTPIWYEVTGDDNIPVNFSPLPSLNTGCATVLFVGVQEGMIVTAEPTYLKASAAPDGYSFPGCGLNWYVTDNNISASSIETTSLVTGTICFPQPPSGDGYIFKLEETGWIMVLPSFEISSSDGGALFTCVTNTPGEYALAVTNSD